MIAESVPAAEAMVWTMLFPEWSKSRNARSTAIEITAAGIDVANGDADFPAEIDVRRGENHRDQRAEYDPAQRQFPGHRARPRFNPTCHPRPLSNRTRRAAPA